jgi:HAD superfamily hydrolase (TIGR01509 family)
MNMKQTVIFDLGGVLLREAEVNLHKVENDELLQLLNTQTDRLRIFNRAFAFAAFIDGIDYKTDWIIGTRSGDEIVQKIKEHIHNAAYDSFFRDEHERMLIKHGIEYIVTPHLLTQLTEIINEGLAFVQQCKASNIEVAIISNWDPISFAILRAQMPLLFDLFHADMIIIPHLVGAAKPSLAIYDYAIKKMNVDPAHCFFVDDSHANVEGAQRYGIKSVHHKNWDETKEELIKYGLKLKN